MVLLWIRRWWSQLRFRLQWTRSPWLQRGSGCVGVGAWQWRWLSARGRCEWRCISWCLQASSWTACAGVGAWRWRRPCDTGRRCRWCVTRNGYCDTYLGASWAKTMRICSRGISTPTVVFSAWCLLSGSDEYAWGLRPRLCFSCGMQGSGCL